MRFLLLIVFFPVVLLGQTPDTVIGGKRYVLYSSYERPDSIIVFEYCQSILKSGSANGEYRAYAQSGVLMEQGQWRNGKRVGAWFSYFPDGKVEHSGNYKKGWAIGTWTWYHPNGVVKGKARYVQKTVWKKVKVGSIQQTVFWTPKRYYPWFRVNIQPTPVDSFVEYYPDSKVKVRMRFNNDGEQIDSTEYYYPSGQLNCIQYWKDNRGVGCWRYYCSDGTLTRCENQEAEKPETCVGSDEIYIECSYYEIVPEIQLYKGGIRAKF